jgi:aromatic-L-amino-acid decarboxylase
VVNPHKWLFTPVDLSVLYCRRMDSLRAAFALTPEYILSGDEAEAARRNLMNTGIQLGRRFRSLKLWMILRSFGAKAIRAHLAEHIRLAQLFATWVDAHPDFERVAPVPLSVVCFRWSPLGTTGKRRSDAEIDGANERLLARVNASGEVFLSHTQLREGVALRLAVGHAETTERHVRRAWELLVDHAATLR